MRGLTRDRKDYTKNSGFREWMFIFFHLSTVWAVAKARMWRVSLFGYDNEDNNSDSKIDNNDSNNSMDNSSSGDDN